MFKRLRDWFSPPKVVAADSRVRQLVNEMRMLQRARYDAAVTTDEYKNIWANADSFDADSAHSVGVRRSLVQRSRYEVANNGYADGIAQTYATDLVGIGPTLRMQTGSIGFNQLIEREFYEWSKAVQLRRKLWCMAHAKHTDGEAIAVIRRNPSVNHAIKLDVVLYETEHCHTPYLPFGQRNYIDGIKFDEFGNPAWYDILPEHPGATNQWAATQEPERVPAEFVLHWYKMRRPGQHRGVPESASTLNIGAAFRRLREANLSTAEKVAAWTLFLETAFQPSEEEMESMEALTTVDIAHGMMTALPNSVKPTQLRAEHPGPTYDSFHRSLLNEQARPKNMPFNKAACDSASYNYASGRLDHQTYYAALNVERADGDDLVLDKLFRIWFDAAVRRFGWLGGVPESIGAAARAHAWDWPKHQVADIQAEASANETKLKSGQVGLSRLFTEAGLDIDDEISVEAQVYGITPDEYRKRLLDVILPPPKQEAAPSPPPSAPPAADAILSRVNGRANGHGAIHAN